MEDSAKELDSAVDDLYQKQHEKAVAGKGYFRNPVIRIHIFVVPDLTPRYSMRFGDKIFECSHMDEMLRKGTEWIKEEIERMTGNG